MSPLLSTLEASADISTMSTTPDRSVSDTDANGVSALTSENDSDVGTGATAGLRRTAREIKNICCVGAGYVGMCDMLSWLYLRGRCYIGDYERGLINPSRFSCGSEGREEMKIIISQA